MKNLILLIFILFTNSELTWKSDYIAVRTEARESNKNILIYFSGSDWCKPCIQLKSLILDSDEFKSYSKDHFIPYQADFPRMKKNKPNEAQQIQNEKLAAKYNQKGIFPLIVIVDANENVLSKIEYKHQSPEEFIQQLEQL